MRHALIISLAIAACGPGLARSKTADEDGASLFAADGKAAAMRTLLADHVTYGGLWFDDATCVAEFAGAGVIASTGLDEFARCLAALHFEKTDRRNGYVDGVVLTYGPGFEVEALIRDELAPTLLWIGYAGRQDARDSLPAITPRALEALRTTGDRNGPLDQQAVAQLTELEQRPDVPAHAWLKVCINADGEVTRVRVLEATSPAAMHVFSDAANSWRFRSFTAGGHAIPVCSSVRLVYPPEKVPHVEVLPAATEDGEPFVMSPTAVEAKRISGRRLVVPTDRIRIAIQRAGAHRIIGSFKICIDTTGHVSGVKTLRSTGISSYDAALIHAMNEWVYSPFVFAGTPQAVCTGVTFVYTQH